MPAKPQLHGTSHVRVRVRLRLTLFLSSLALVSSPNLLRRRGGGGNRQIRIACTISRFVRLSGCLSRVTAANMRKADVGLLTLSSSLSRLPLSSQQQHSRSITLGPQYLSPRRLGGEGGHIYGRSEFGGRRISEMASPVRLTQLLLCFELKY